MERYNHFCDISQDFERSPAVDLQDAIVLTHNNVIAPMLQTLFWMLLLAAVHANAPFKALLEALHMP